MLRTTVGVSMLALLSAVSACSSKSTGNTTATGVGGNGAGLGGATSGGSAVAGGSGGGGGGLGRAGAATGGTTGACPQGSLSCVDDISVTLCDPATGEVDTFSCVDEYAALGFTSTGCSVDATGEGCDVTAANDAACENGAAAYGYCAQATDEEFFNIYVNCFQDNDGAHTVVPCFAKYVSATMTAEADCQNAITACLPGAGGAGPIPDDGAGGVGGGP